MSVQRVGTEVIRAAGQPLIPRSESMVGELVRNTLEQGVIPKAELFLNGARARPVVVMSSFCGAGASGQTRALTLIIVCQQ
jgi:hypothetical protein